MQPVDSIITSPTEKWCLLERKHLYIRECYLDELRRFRELRDNYIKDKSSEKEIKSERPNFLYIGTSGLGKSSFLMFVMASLLHEAKHREQIISFRFTEKVGHDEKDYLLKSDGSCAVYNDEVVDYYFSDSKDITSVGDVGSGVILVTSVKSEESERFNKANFTRTRSSIPTWTYEELLRIKPSTFTNEECRLRFEVFGGSPRNFLLKDQAVDIEGFEYVDEVMRILFKEYIGQPSSCWKAISGLVQERLCSISNVKVGEIAANNLNSLMWHSNDGRTSFWASKCMQFIGGIIHEKKITNLETLVGAMFGPSGRGCYFEFKGHQTIMSQNTIYKVYGFCDASFDLTLNKPVLKKFHSIDDIARLEDGEYGLPFASNFPLIDAVIQPNILLQFTIAKRHEGAVEKLESIRCNLRAERKDHMMIFVVDNMRDFKKQNDLGDIKQYKMSYNTV